ncbi:MAG: type II toxin-antitoxin system RelE/ParE family toxin [Rhizobiales bacterium]|nr:type II toxin-antitoxin system RelE/ParE family toxin [Hyphomicrobiales bacterium]
MPLTLKFSAKARRDLLEISGYLQRRSPQGAKSVLRAIERSCLLLAETPLAARRTNMESVRVKPLSRHPYQIFYRVEGKILYVVHVWHSARKPVSEKKLL